MKGTTSRFWWTTLWPCAPCAAFAAACSGSTARLPGGATDNVTSEAGPGTVTSTQTTSGSSSSLSSSVTDAGAPSTEAGYDGGDATMGEAAPSPCAGLTVCDDFEGETLGQPPKTSLWAITAPMCNPQRGTATVDSTHAHSGTQAVKVVNDFGDAGGPPNYCDHVFFTNVSAFATATPQQVYARFYVYFGEPLSMGHVTFATMTDKNAMPGNGDQLRLGLNSEVFVWNRESDDAYLPELDMGGIDVQTSVTPMAQSWTCVEVHLDEIAGGIQAWVNGNSVDAGLIVGLSEDGAVVPNVSTVWVGTDGRGLSPVHHRLRPRMGDVQQGTSGRRDGPMVDDVAIASHPIGCLP